MGSGEGGGEQVRVEEAQGGEGRFADLEPSRDASCYTWTVPERGLDRSAAPTSVQPCPWLH